MSLRKGGNGMAKYRGKRLSAVPDPPPEGRAPSRLDPSLAVPEEARKPRRPKRLAPPRFPLVVRLLFLAALLTTAGSLGLTTARYLKDWSQDSLATAGSFYFASAELNGGTHRLTGDKTMDFSFTLRNYLVAGYPTKSAISYTCQVTDSKGKLVSNVKWLNSDNAEIGTAATGDGVSDSAAGGVFTGSFAANDGGEAGGQTKTLICRIPKNAFGAKGDQVLTLTARATSPYSATLEVRLALTTGGVQMVVTDPGAKNGAVSVALYNTDEEAHTVELKWPAGNEITLVSDPTWDVVPTGSGDKTTGRGTVTVPGKGAVSMVFLKKDTTQNFTEEDFPFTVTDAAS